MNDVLNQLKNHVKNYPILITVTTPEAIGKRIKWLNDLKVLIQQLERDYILISKKGGHDVEEFYKKEE